MLRELYQKHRRRLATLALAVFVAAVAVEVGGAIPRETRVDIPLGPGHGHVTQAHVDFWDGGESVRSVALRWPHGAPRTLRQTIDLSPGEYEVTVVLVDRDGARRELRGRVRAPAEGVVRLAPGGS